MANLVDDYIAAFPPETQKKLQEIRRVIKENAPEAVEGISYRMPSYKMGKYLVHFAGYKSHIGFYPTPSAITHFKKELSIYKSAKGSAQFPLTEPLPVKLISQMVKFRVQENLSLK